MPRPVTLAIETSNPSSGDDAAGVALGVVEGERVELIDVESLRSERKHDDALMPAIDRVCARAGVKPSELARVAVSVGPGGYTAVRIAVTTAKLICEATGAECVGVPTPSVGAVGGGPPDVPFGVALASKRETVHVTAFEARSIRGDGGRLVDPGTFGELVASSGMRVLFADRFLPEAVHEIAVERGVSVEPLRLNAESCLRASAGNACVDPASLQVAYPREPEAVSKWRDLHS